MRSRASTRPASSESSLEAQARDGDWPDQRRLTALERTAGSDLFLAESGVQPLGDERDPRLSAELPPLLQPHVDTEEGVEARPRIGRLRHLGQPRVEDHAGTRA